MRLQTSLGVTVLVSALFASPVYATNCSISYYCYRSMTPGPAPVTPVATSRPNPNGSARPANLQQPRPVNAQTVRPQLNPTPPQTAPALSTAAQRLAEQQRAQTLADQRRLAALRQNQSNSSSSSSRVAPAPPQTPARVIPAPPQTPIRQTPARTSTPANAAGFRPVDNQSCNTLALKIKVLESQATSQARNQQQAKAQELFKIAEDLRKQAKTKACTI